MEAVVVGSLVTISRPTFSGWAADLEVGSCGGFFVILFTTTAASRLSVFGGGQLTWKVGVVVGFPTFVNNDNSS